MRFFADGPSIPDELLWERDEGKVVFFCGAGVSRAYAGLPDFFGLANKVAEYLKADKDSAAYQLIHQRDGNEKNNVVGGSVSADYIFGLLERDFFQKDIEEAVASALDPEKQRSPKDPDYLKAHQILLDLATNRHGKIRLVTTNFDRLFEQCRKKLKIWQPPNLPDPSRVDEMDGIVYLHGLATKDYKGAEGDGFILSTSQFGKAYLAEGWATKFIRQLLDNYTIVFVGYSADDPPVQYLLEALHKMKATHNKIYAFQSDDGEDVINRWKYKGVMPICFPAGGYDILWKTLEAWAKRARNPDKWYEQVIKKFASNPRALQPFERGQIAHIVSSSEGAKKFAHAKPVPSAEWLYVFDSSCRNTIPDQVNPSSSNKNFMGIHILYGLDTDNSPQDSDLGYSEQMVRTFSWKRWDAFDISSRDHASVDIQNLNTLQENVSQLVNRLEQLTLWFTKVLDQPAALFWAAIKFSLNHVIINTISRELVNHSHPINPLIRQRWQLIVSAWEKRTYFRNALSISLWKNGEWNATVVEQFEKLTRPYFSVKSTIYLQPIPQKLKINRKNVNQFAPVAIEYPYSDQPLDIPDKWCYASLKALRRNLEIAILYEKEIGRYGQLPLQPIVCDKEDKNSSKRTPDLSGMIIYFARLFNRLCKIDPSAAKFEFLSWPRDDDIVFAHLRIWAAGKPEIVANDEFGQFISSLPDEIFWNWQHQQDLLMVLKKRWDNLNSSTRAMIEKRLLKNSSRLSREDQCTRKKRHAYLSLNNLWWLKSNGCELSSATQKKAQKLRSVAPDWTEEQARNSERHITSGFVATNTDYTALLNIPLSELLPEAEKIQQSRDDFSIVNRPFEGLVENKPVRAFSALCLEVKKGIFREWAWQTFFYSKPHKADQNRFKLLIANRLLNCPDEQIAKIFIPVVYWLSNNAEKLENTYITDFFHLAKKLVEILRIQPDNDQSNIEQSIDKLSDAANAPAGMMTLALLSAAFVQNLNDKSFHKEWSKQMESLLKLPYISRQYVLVMLFTHINWFFKTDKDWTRKNLLPIFHNSKSIDHDAAWSGFLNVRELPYLEIFKTIKGDLLTIVENRPSFYLKNIDHFSELVLASWNETDNATGTKRITDEELQKLLLKSGDELRTGILKEAAFRISIRNKNPSDQWKSRLPELFSIWPKQMKAWSPEVSTGFFKLLIWSGEQFPVLLNLVLKRLNKIYDLSSADLYSLTVSGFGNTIIQDYPKELLELLFSVLPDDARQWSYEMNIILEQIIEADSSLKKNERYVELKRRYSI